MSSTISSHVLDTMKGSPASGMNLKLEYLAQNNTWELISNGITNSDGRVSKDNFPKLTKFGTYRVIFDTSSYFKANNVINYFFPEVIVIFNIQEPFGQHYHIPLLISPFGYSTYRGS
jgi:5-hydroxyisourate hydrolase